MPGEATGLDKSLLSDENETRITPEGREWVARLQCSTPWATGHRRQLEWSTYATLMKGQTAMARRFPSQLFLFISFLAGDYYWQNQSYPDLPIITKSLPNLRPRNDQLIHHSSFQPIKTFMEHQYSLIVFSSADQW